MDEFVKLYLTGKRAAELEAFTRIVRIVGVIGALFALIPVILSFRGVENGAAAISLTALGIAFSLAEGILRYMRNKRIKIAVESENEANAARSGERSAEERALYAKLYEGWQRSYGREDPMPIAAAVCKIASYAAVASSVLAFTFLDVPEWALLAACLAAAVVMSVSAVLSSVADGRSRAKLYETAGEEIEEWKRTKWGAPERKIMAETENARGYSSIPHSVVMFLKEDGEKEAFRKIANRSGLVSLLLGAAFFVFIALSFFREFWDRLGPTASWSAAMAGLFLIFCLFFAAVLPLEAQKREIYRRNYAKLGGGEADGLRKELQAAWIALQRRGNVMFACFLVGSVALGAAVGGIGFALVEDTNLAACVGSSILLSLLAAAVVSMVVWAVMFALYRRNVRATEMLLKEKEREERRENGS